MNAISSVQTEGTIDVLGTLQLAMVCLFFDYYYYSHSHLKQKNSWH